VRRGTGSLYRRAQSLRFLLGRDRAAVLAFLRACYPIDISLRERLAVVARFVAITNHVRTYHTQAEMLRVVDRILRLAGRPDLTVVEAGSGKGGGTAKLSLVARRAGGRLVVFDSFRGIPPNDEVHRNVHGRRVEFRAGAFRGRLPSVCRTVARFGAPEVCEFRKGWFADTLPAWDGHVDVALLDVDLLSSTRTCLTHLVPRLRPGGVVLTQDGHLEAVVALLGDARFWRDEVGVEPPSIAGLGRRKLLQIEPTARVAAAPRTLAGSVGLGTLLDQHEGHYRKGRG
jgi:O-methyltransferase